MNKILNWTFGAFFRTIGRIFAFLCISIFFVFILSKLDIKLPDWLAIARVNATSTQEWGGNIEQGFTDAYYFDLTSNGYSQLGLALDQFQRYGTNDILTSYGNTPRTTIGPNGTMLAFNLNQRTMNGYLYSITIYQCATSRIYWENTIADLFVGGNSDTVASRPANSTMYQETNITELAGADLSCYMTTSLFVPNTNTNNSWIGLRLRARGANIPNIFMRAYGFTIREMGIYNETITNTIKNSGFATAQSVQEVNNAVNQVKQELNNVNDSVNNGFNNLNNNLNNSDTSGANDTANGFFDNFSDNDHGLSSIITAPLRAINAMLSNQCVAPGATYKGQSFSLPCGSMLWSRPGGEDFRNFINIFYGGFLAYFVIRSLFLDIEKLKNPDNDKVEVEKL